MIFCNILVMTHHAPKAYQARFRPNRLSLLTVAGCAAFCVVVSVAQAPLFLRVVTFGFFGLGGLVMVVSTLTFQVALRVDHAGIMIRRYAIQPSSVMFYPWEDVDRILIWQDSHYKRLGVQRGVDAPSLPARRIRPVVQRHLAVSAPQIPLDVAATSAPAVAWHLDERRLAHAVTRFAPTVEVLNVTNGQRLPAEFEPGHES